jgi:hypothetical protein
VLVLGPQHPTRVTMVLVDNRLRRQSAGYRDARKNGDNRRCESAVRQQLESGKWQERVTLQPVEFTGDDVIADMAARNYAMQGISGFSWTCDAIRPRRIRNDPTPGPARPCRGRPIPAPRARSWPPQACVPPRPSWRRRRAVVGSGGTAIGTKIYAGGIGDVRRAGLGPRH